MFNQISDKLKRVILKIGLYFTSILASLLYIITTAYAQDQITSEAILLAERNNLSVLIAILAFILLIIVFLIIKKHHWPKKEDKKSSDYEMTSSSGETQKNMPPAQEQPAQGQSQAPQPSKGLSIRMPWAKKEQNDTLPEQSNKSVGSVQDAIGQTYPEGKQPATAQSEISQASNQVQTPQQTAEGQQEEFAGEFSRGGAAKKSSRLKKKRNPIKKVKKLTSRKSLVKKFKPKPKKKKAKTKAAKKSSKPKSSGKSKSKKRKK